MKEKRRRTKIVWSALTICLVTVIIIAIVLAVLLTRQNPAITILSTTKITSTKSFTPLTTITTATMKTPPPPPPTRALTTTIATTTATTITTTTKSKTTTTTVFATEIKPMSTPLSSETISEIYTDMLSSSTVSPTEEFEETTMEMMSTEKTIESTGTFSFLDKQTRLSTYSATTVDSTLVLVNCVYPFALSSSGVCVNLLIDRQNCGTVDYVCPSNYTSCSNGLCSPAPGVQLTDPIPIFTAALNGSIDDEFYKVTVPFGITLYGTTTQTVQVTTNGVLCLGNCFISYTETTLPTSEFSDSTAFAYWDDLYIFSNTSQGIYYQTHGNTPNRTLTFEYYCSHFLADTEYYHFQVVFFENNPGVVRYIYYDISDKGASCTVGVQASSAGPYMQYSFQQTYSINNNMTLTFDTNSGAYTRG